MYSGKRGEKLQTPVTCGMEDADLRKFALRSQGPYDGMTT